MIKRLLFLPALLLLAAIPAPVLAQTSALTSNEPIYYTGIILIIVGFLFFVAEVFVTSFGILTAGGLVSLVIGSIILFEGGALSGTGIAIIIVAAIAFIVFLGFVVNRVVKAHRRQVATGREELIGKTAEVRTALDPEGTVFYEGELWTAVLDRGRAEPREEVIIKGQDGLKLYVTKKSKEES